MWCHGLQGFGVLVLVANRVLFGTRPMVIPDEVSGHLHILVAAWCLAAVCHCHVSSWPLSWKGSVQRLRVPHLDQASRAFRIPVPVSCEYLYIPYVALRVIVDANSRK